MANELPPSFPYPGPDLFGPSRSPLSDDTDSVRTTSSTNQWDIHHGYTFDPRANRPAWHTTSSGPSQHSFMTPTQLSDGIPSQSEVRSTIELSYHTLLIYLQPVYQTLSYDRAISQADHAELLRTGNMVYKAVLGQIAELRAENAAMKTAVCTAQAELAGFR